MRGLFFFLAVIAVAYCDLKGTIQGYHDGLLSSQTKDNMKIYWTEDAKYIDPTGKIIEGLNSIYDHFNEAFKAMGEIEETKTTVETVIEQGDTVIDLGTFHVKAKAGTPSRHRHRRSASHNMHFQYMSIWKKVGDKHKIVVDGTWMKKAEE